MWTRTGTPLAPLHRGGADRGDRLPLAIRLGATTAEPVITIGGDSAPIDELLALNEGCWRTCTPPGRGVRPGAHPLLGQALPGGVQVQNRPPQGGHPRVPRHQLRVRLRPGLPAGGAGAGDRGGAQPDRLPPWRSRPWPWRRPSARPRSCSCPAASPAATSPTARPSSSAPSSATAGSPTRFTTCSSAGTA